MTAPARTMVIAGLPRSGTTLLATFLAGQPRVSFLTDYLHSFVRAAARTSPDDWRRPLSTTQRRVALAIVRDELLRFRHPVLVGVDGFRSIADLHEAVLRELTRPGDLVVGHKMLLTDTQLASLLNETAHHVVVLYRDPRDAAVSYYHRTGGGVERYLDSWRRMVRLIASKPHPRLFGLRYETLVTEPMTALAPLFGTLRLPLDTQRARLVFNRGNAGSLPWPGNASFEPAGRPFDASALERWRSMLDSPIVRYAASTCGAEVRTLGYPDGPKLPILEAVRWKVHRNLHAALTNADRRWETGKERILDRLAPPLHA